MSFLLTLVFSEREREREVTFAMLLPVSLSSVCRL